MRKKLETAEDIQLLVRTFYDKVFKDEMLSPYFIYIKNNEWNKHLETMYLFWNNIVFYTGGYYGNPMEVHKKLHHFKGLSKDNFERWLLLFTTTVDELYRGEKAELIKQRSNSIATVMQLKILPQQQPNEPTHEG